jgi:single-strand DNA-binding protein
MEITGTVKKIMDVQQVSPAFRKRELVVQTDEQYPQPILVEFTQDRADLLNRVQEGQKVTVSINIRGREWTSKENETRYYVSIQGWRIQNAENATPSAPPSQGATYGGGAPVATTPAAPNTNAFDGDDDDLPF